MGALAKLMAGDGTVVPTDSRPIVYATTAYARGIQARFLAAYSKLGRVCAAAESIGIPVDRHYDWLHNDTEYPPKFSAAQRAVAGLIEDEMIRRGVDGVDRGVYWRGERVAVEKEYSDQLLVTLAKGLLPDKYGKAASEDATRSLRVELVYAGPAPAEPQLAAPEPPQLAAGEQESEGD